MRETFLSCGGLARGALSVALTAGVVGARAQNAGMQSAGVHGQGLGTRPASMPAGEGRWVVTSVDGGVATGELDLTAPSFLRAEVPGAKVVWAGGLVLFLRDGQQIPGVPVASGDGESLGWEHPTLGKLAFALKLVRGVGPAGRPPVVVGNEDVAVLANGDSVRGVVSESTGEMLTLTPSSGEAVRVPWKSIGHLSLADLGGKAGAAFSGWQVELTDGTVLRAAEVSKEGDRLVIGAARVPLASVAVVERMGPAWSLALLGPSESVERPYLTVEHPPKFGEARVGGVRYRRAIETSPYTKLTWHVPDGVTRFRAECIATEGRAVVTVTAGDQKFEREIGAGESVPVELSVPAGADVTVTVGFSGSAIAGRVLLLDPLVSR